MIRLLIVDDHAFVREGMQLLFATEPDIEVVGTAADGETALQQVRDVTPDVVLMDIRMPNVDGVEATRRIMADRPMSKIVIVTASHDHALVRAALDSGAVRCLPKHGNGSDLIQAVRDAGAGKRVTDR